MQVKVWWTCLCLPEYSYRQHKGWISLNCYSDSMWCSWLVWRNHVPWRHGPLAQCSMIKGARYIAPCVWISIGLEWKRRSLLIAATRVWSYDRMEFYVKIGSLSHSFLLPLSLFFIIFLLFYICLFFSFFISFSLLFFSFFFSPSFFFSSKPEMTPSSNKDTPWYS
jgi:hypothetical protein